ncbi:response regulator [Lysobacter sp. S4-A87]|uniref:response regulator n=1 Tax=Lysobacter sp. S4-A87 TaxID=2925843 RepID=UPI001F52DAFB|nr:response regulator [Lysobacter sp. S4-A87]UNK48166.1 response regulator [Lysobacter sp. S4-A87]
MPNVLIVDDDLVNRKLARAILERAGWTTVECENGASALECFQREHFDAVLLDIGLPGMNGREVCQALRQQQRGPLRIVAYTASVLPEEMETLVENGFDDVLQKPVSIGAVEAAFKTA